MARLTKDEFMKLAHASHIKLHEQEIPKLMESIESVLAYASGLSEVVAHYQRHAHGTAEQVILMHNVMRADQVIPTDPEPLLALAPDREDRYFVVPVIISQNHKNL